MAAPRALLATAAAVALVLHAATLQVGAAASAAVGDVEAVREATQRLQQRAEASLNATVANATAAADASTAKARSDTASAVDAARASVDSLVQDAQAEGVEASSCGATAAQQLDDIWSSTLSSLAHCQTDYLDAFDYYGQNIERDFSKAFDAIGTALTDARACGLLDAVCLLRALADATAAEARAAGDAAFQVFNAGTAAINLVATIAKCDEDTSAQAALDAAAVVAQAATCIRGKKNDAATS